MPERCPLEEEAVEKAEASVEAEVDEVGVGMPVASSLSAGGKEITRLGRVNPVLPMVAISSSPVLACNCCCSRHVKWTLSSLKVF